MSCCIPWSSTLNVRQISEFRLGTRSLYNYVLFNLLGTSKGALTYRIEAKMLDGGIRVIDGYSSSQRQYVVDKLNNFIPLERRPVSTSSLIPYYPL